jgi:uncharacterized damage-inducible protein DinB
MDKNTFELLVKYNRGVNQQMNSIIKTLSGDEWNRQFPGYFKSIHELCSHIFIWDYTWLCRFRTVNNFESLDEGYFSKEYDFSETLFKDIDEYLIKRQELDNIFVNFINEIRADDLDRELKWKNADGAEFREKLPIMLTHLFNHETHHRGMISLYLEFVGKENDYS